MGDIGYIDDDMVQNWALADIYFSKFMTMAKMVKFRQSC